MSKLENKFKTIDLFGMDINLSIGEKEKLHKMNYLPTNFGACATILFVLAMLGITAGEVSIVYHKEHPHYSISDLHFDATEFGSFDYFDDSLNMIIGTTNTDINLFDNPYISINVYELTEKWQPKISDTIKLK